MKKKNFFLKKIFWKIMGFINWQILDSLELLITSKNRCLILWLEPPCICLRNYYYRFYLKSNLN